MKIDKKNLNDFLVAFDKMVKKLSDDLIVYRQSALITLSDADLTKKQMQSLNLSDHNEVVKLAEEFFFHRLNSFEDRMAGDVAIELFETILRNAESK